MRTVALAVVVTAALSTGALADPVAPDDVKFEQGAVGQSLSGAAGDPANGAKIVGSKKLGNCVACHMASALSNVPWQGGVGPSLDGAGDRWSEAQLRGIVANAKNTFDGTVMPSFYKVSGFIRPGDGYTGNAATDIKPILSAQQIEDVVAFLKTLKQ